MCVWGGGGESYSSKGLCSAWTNFSKHMSHLVVWLSSTIHWSVDCTQFGSHSMHTG